MMSLHAYLILSAILFGLGVAGMVVNRKHIIVSLMSLELMLLAVNTNFLAFSHYGGAVVGQIFVFFILTVAAAETAVGLAIVVLFYRKRGTLHVDDMHTLKG